MESPLLSHLKLVEAVAALAIEEQCPALHQEARHRAAEDPFDPKEEMERIQTRLATSLSQPCPSSSLSSDGVDPLFATDFIAIVSMLGQGMSDLAHTRDLMLTYNIRPDKTMLAQARTSVARFCRNIDNVTLNLEAQVNKLKK